MIRSDKKLVKSRRKKETESTGGLQAGISAPGGETESYRRHSLTWTADSMCAALKAECFHDTYSSES